MKKLAYTETKNFPPFLDQIVLMDPKDLVIDAYARILCTNCGLYNRGILCPPLLPLTYPQFKTIDSSREYFDSFDEAYLYVFKNDGRRRWWYQKEWGDFAHIKLQVRLGRQLKGVEASSARKLTHLMKKAELVNKKRGFTVATFIQGHCDKCGKCPNRSNPPCKKGGLPSLEATGINVYSLLKKLGIPYEYPVRNYLTQVALMVKKNDS